MAEVKNQSSEEHSPLPPKRKQQSDVECLDQQAEDPKKKKLEVLESLDGEEKHNVEAEKPVTQEEEEEEEDDDDDEEEEEDEDEDDDDDEEEEEEEEEEEVLTVDRKGKGIMQEDKGKGKLVMEEDESDSDVSDRFNDSDVDTDLSDDPLAEVDLDNILPSRTRRRAPPPPGAYEVNDLGDDSDDDSDA